MNFRKNETKRYFQKNFFSLSLSFHTQRWKRRFQRVNYDNYYKIGRDTSKYFLFHNARNINAGLSSRLFDITTKDWNAN